jgi:hypothetical protein
MKHFAVAAVTAGALTAAALGFAGIASAAPDGPASAVDTINHLQSQGYNVIVTKVGNAALENCTVSAIRGGQPVSMLERTTMGNRHLVERIQYTTVYVDASC